MRQVVNVPSVQYYVEILYTVPHIDGQRLKNSWVAFTIERVSQNPRFTAIITMTDHHHKTSPYT